MKWWVWVGIFVLGALPLLGNGCSKFGAGSTSALVLESSLGTGPAAFKSGLYTFAQNQGCVQCHGGVVRPRFAVSDLNAAYSEAKGSRLGSNAPLIDFDNPDRSVFLVYAGNGHCNSLPCSDPAVRPQLKNLLEEWAAAEIAAGGGQDDGPKMYVTESLPIPEKLPILTAGSPVVMRFDLGKLNPAIPELEGAVFEVSIQKANETQYRLVNPRIGGNKQAVNVKGIHLYVRPVSGSGLGFEDTAQGIVWVDVDKTLEPSTLPASGPLTTTPLSTSTLFIQAQSTQDVLTIGFESL